MITQILYLFYILSISYIKYLFNKKNTPFIIYTENEPINNIYGLKISGIWNTDNTCGIACKFFIHQ